MKKIISIALILCMVLIACVSVNAASNTVSRGLLASMLAESSNYSEEAKNSAMFSVFSDVGKSTTYAQDIYIASRQGWMLGYTDGSFKPNNSVKLEEVCCAIYKFLGNDSKNLTGSFREAYIQKANSAGWLDGTSLKLGDYVTISECQQIMHNAGVGDYKTYGSYLGVIQSVSKSTNADDGSVEGVYTLKLVDGSTKTFSSSSQSSYTAGTIVRVDVSSAKTSVTSVKEQSVSGYVNNDVTKIGTKAISSELQVIETDKYGNVAVVDSELLAGRSLDSSDVRYYTLNAANEINVLILNDCVGNISSYGICTSTELGENRSSYSYILNGKSQTSSSTTQFVCDEGGVEIKVVNGSLEVFRQLNKVSVNSLTDTSAVSDYKTYTVAEDVQVYIRNTGTYYQSSLDAIINSSYSHIDTYIDTKGFGLIRLIIAY